MRQPLLRDHLPIRTDGLSYQTRVSAGEGVVTGGGRERMATGKAAACVHKSKGFDAPASTNDTCVVLSWCGELVNDVRMCAWCVE